MEYEYQYLGRFYVKGVGVVWSAFRDTRKGLLST